MILVILPLGKEAQQVGNWVARVIMYTAASVLGASTLALLLGLVGRGLHIVLPWVRLEWAVALLGAASLLYGLHELNIIHLPNPQIGWQVPKSWQRSSRLVGNTLYGYVLGMGIFTFIPFTSFYVLLGWELVAGAMSIKMAVTIGAIYGLSRGVPVVVGGISMLRGTYPMPVSNWLIAHLGWWHAINALALLFIGSFLLGSLFI
ncbi:MAG TPA: hypothetical protein VM409_02835 [Chloroflexia bacterium]|nr:hypothetical protein [Chloroflexia bacterium]